MCIFLATTAHPSYALIILNNRDEFILRPTSRPHWWSSPHQKILSARDLQRTEQGTWLGMTKTGNFAALTNFRETDTHGDAHPIQGERSRGGIVTAWLTSPEDESTEQFVHRMLTGDGLAGVRGFSLVCGKLRRQRHSSQDLEPLAVISNRSVSPNDVPWIVGKRGEVYGLSNTSYDDPIIWPKVTLGQEKLLKAVEEAVDAMLDEDSLVDRLYAVLDTNTLTEQDGRNFEEYVYELRNSIFIPSIGTAAAPEIVRGKVQTATGGSMREPQTNGGAEMNIGAGAELKQERRTNAQADFWMTGIYGTQRQTILLVDWEGHVKFRERSLWDKDGNAIERGVGDMKFEFHIEGWNEGIETNEEHPQ